MIPIGDDEENPSEYLLVFDTLGVYVDSYGRRSRAQELMFPCRVVENGYTYHKPYLSLYSESEIDVFHVELAQWVQTINLRKAKALSDNGLLNLCYVNDMPYLVFLNSLNESQENQLHVPSHCQSTISSGKGVQKRRRKFSVRTSKDDNAGKSDRKSTLPISAPSGFVHVVHMGPGSVFELQNHLIDIKSPNNSMGSDKVSTVSL